jgi:hypothetical protein
VLWLDCLSVCKITVKLESPMRAFRVELMYPADAEAERFFEQAVTRTLT